MHMTRALAALLVLCLDLSATIRVPIAWQHGEVTKESNDQLAVVNVGTVNPQHVERKPIPTEYFEYSAKKPQFAVEVAASHGVPSPDKHYKAYPIKPHTNQVKPHLGVHHILQGDKKVFQPFQKFVQKQQIAVPVSSNYEVFHPYKGEVPALQEIYNDPVLTKIRNDLENNKNRLQNYEQKAGESDITKDEYDESPQQTDKKLFPQKNYPTEFEIHKPQRKPVYYQVSPKHNNRDNAINKKLKHPWNQNYVKIKPVHYYPLHNHIQNLRQHQAVKYDDEQHEYPQVIEHEKQSEPSDGYDIYENGKQNYERLRDNVDESINKAVLENKPAIYRKVELDNDQQNDDNEDDDDEEEDEFVPIKNYAQVRKTESVKHLPREAALEDAETYEEIKNAPRLREAVKSTKAQTVYTEEGYEDTAYDHAGEQKHASDHERHGGFLKQNEASEGKFKIPSIAVDHDDGAGSEYKDQILHGKKWKNDDRDYEKSVDRENHAEKELEQSAEIDAYRSNSEDPNRNKRDNIEDSDENQSDRKNESIKEHDVNKREVDIEVPEINLNSTFLSEKEILEIAKLKLENKQDESKEKYPYYFNKIKSINKHSPLRYAENLQLIPKKSKGGTEFYDSRSKLQCPEVEDVDPLPEKLKNGDNPTEHDDDDDGKQENKKGEEGFDVHKKQPRLRNLGDKIDCFKAKYFGENPLDSPFFKEDLILNPEPVTLPNLPTYKLNNLNIQPALETEASEVVEKIDAIQKDGRTDVFVLLDRLRSDQNKLSDSVITKHDTLQKAVIDHHNSITPRSHLKHESNIYNDILENIQKQRNDYPVEPEYDYSFDFLEEQPKVNQSTGNEKYVSYQNKEDITKAPPSVRKKRSTSFIYEPYKIIRESQAQDSKKTTTSSNISPLIKQMQSNRVVDRVTRANQEPGKRRNKKEYKDIGRSDREKNAEKGDEVTSEPKFVDVNIDQRRGEPRYEIKHPNHKPEYKPVENKKNMSLEDYQAQKESGKTTTEKTVVTSSTTKRNSRQRRPTPKPVFDVSEFLPNETERQTVAASNTVKRTVTTIPPPVLKSTSATITTHDSQETPEESDSEEEYEEYDDEESEEQISTTTTTTAKPIFKRRRIATTTEAAKVQQSTEVNEPKLRLVTRFRNYNTDQQKSTHDDDNKDVEKHRRKGISHEDDTTEKEKPKYREKKKKSTKSTLVTDTKKYGDDVDDMKEEEIDAMIGVKHDMKDYMPDYEKKYEGKYRDTSRSEDFDDSIETFDDPDDENSSSEEVDDDDEDEEEEEDDEEIETKPTTPEPTKRTLVQTTDAPVPTVAARSAKIELKPVVSRKKIEIHKELPADKASPHLTQFKQDIKEVEIIKEVTPAPKKHLRKHKEALELYKDDKLAEEINNLGDVEVFKENLDLKNGPRHGGNYRSIEDATDAEKQALLQSKEPKDAVASQSENTRHNIELDEYTPRRMHGGNLKSYGDISKSRNSNHNSKLIELSDSVTSRSPMHGGNLRYNSRNSRGRNKFERIVELGDDDHRDHSSKDDNYRNVGNTRRGQAMHGGNYRSARIVQTTTKKPEDNDYDIRVKPEKTTNDRRNSAVLLNSFAQAIPVLTTTPAYILDPSKRMYYYVEA